MTIFGVRRLVAASTVRNSGAGLARISHHDFGRAGLQPRRCSALMIIRMSRAPRSLRPQAARGARQKSVGTAISAELKPRPSSGNLNVFKRGEK